MRLHLILALITVAALWITLRTGTSHRFTFAQVEKMAQDRATEKFIPTTDILPPQLKKLTPQQDAGIFWRDTARLWRKKGLPFQVDFYPQLNSNPQPHLALEINTVDKKGSHQLPYSPSFFNFLNVSVNPPQPLIFNPPLPNNLGYAGFYLRYPDMGIGSNPNSLDGFFSVLGGNYFRAIAKEQVYGLSARGIALNTAVQGKPEEFPLFTEWWLHEPDLNATELIMDALLDGPSVTGAYEFKVRPGAVTSVDVHASLFFRQPVDRLGIAPFSSMYLFAKNAKDHFNDTVHPEIHDSDGVLMHTGADEWVWHPLQQQSFLQMYAFADDNPKGFGLLQRDRDFAHYQDLNGKYNVRPSAWVTPHAGCDQGDLTLVQLNSNDLNTDNVVLFWHPKKPVKAGDHLDVSYTIDFYMNDATKPPLAYCKQTLINNPAPPPPTPPLPLGSPQPGATPAPLTTPTAKTNVPAAAPQAKPTGSAPPASRPPGPMGPPAPSGPPIPVGTTPVQFLVDFVGNGIESAPANQPPDLDLSYDPPGTYLREKSVEKNTYDNSWRVTFTIIPFKHSTPTNLRCRLLRNGKPLTETWSYVWHQ